MAKMSQRTIDLFRDPETSKILATIDANGMPDMAPKGSLVALDESTLAFVVRGSGSNTTANLAVATKVAAAAFKWGAGCQVKGVFQGFQTGGPLFERLGEVTKAMGSPARSLSNVEAVGIIEVQQVS